MPRRTTLAALSCLALLPTADGDLGNDESSAAREAYFTTGLTWQVAEMWQLDGGARVGLTDASADFTPFVGTSTKF